MVFSQNPENRNTKAFITTAKTFAGIGTAHHRNLIKSPNNSLVTLVHSRQRSMKVHRILRVKPQREISTFSNPNHIQRHDRHITLVPLAPRKDKKKQITLPNHKRNHAKQIRNTAHNSPKLAASARPRFQMDQGNSTVSTLHYNDQAALPF